MFNFMLTETGRLLIEGHFGVFNYVSSNISTETKDQFKKKLSHIFHNYVLIPLLKHGSSKEYDLQEFPIPLQPERVKVILSVHSLVQAPIVAKIFSHLGIEEQILCMRVCKAWYRLGKNQHFRTLAGMNETNVTWSSHSHKMMLYMLRAIPEFRNLNRSAYIHFFKQFSITVLKESAIIGMCYITNKFCQDFIDNNINSLNSGSLEEKISWMTNYNDSPVYYGDGEFRPREPYEKFVDPLKYVSFEIRNQIKCKGLTSFFLGGLGVWRLKTAASDIISIWQEKFNVAHQLATSQLSLPLSLAQDPVLSQYVCPLSGRVMLLPVQDECPIDDAALTNGHHHIFDYLAVQNLQEQVVCPISARIIPMQNINFRLDIFRMVQNRLKELVASQSPLLNGNSYKHFDITSPIP